MSYLNVASTRSDVASFNSLSHIFNVDDDTNDVTLFQLSSIILTNALRVNSISSS